MNQDNDNREDEIWKDVVGYEGLYQVSNQGRVKSFWIKDSGRVMKLGMGTGGYLCVNLRKDGKSKTVMIHTLVALIFIGVRPDGLQINHIDGVKTNNHISNLEYCTPAENIHHARKMGLNNTIGENVHSAKLTEYQVLEIRELYKAGGITHKDLASQYGVCRQLIGYIVNRKRWKHI
jgi:hypothetical protein